MTLPGFDRWLRQPYEYPDPNLLTEEEEDEDFDEFDEYEQERCRKDWEIV